MLRRILDSPWLYFGLAGVLLVVAVLSMFQYRGPGRPTGSLAELPSLRDRDDLNVVFIVIDTLRADHVGAYGYERGTSPYIDHLAAQGIRFANVQSQSSWTKTSMASMWTGLYPERTGVLRFEHAVPPEATLASEVFRDAGFLTVGIVRNGWVEANFGFNQGFDVYMLPTAIRTPGRFQVRNPSANPLQGTDENLTQAAREFLLDHKEERFLLYVHYMDVHQYLYESESALFGSSYLDIYDNAIHWVDRNVGSVVRQLQDLGLLDRTVVVIASDHGEAFREHGFEGHARDVYQEVAGTPWIISLPFALEPGVVVDQTVANIDIWPTVLDLVGLPPLAGVDGRSAVPLILASQDGSPTAADRDRPIFAHLERNWARKSKPSRALVAVTQPPYRLIYDVAGETVELYDHSTDPGEMRDEAVEHPEVAARMRAEADGYLERGSQQALEAPRVEVDELRLRQLIALGYAVEKED